LHHVKKFEITVSLLVVLVDEGLCGGGSGGGSSSEPTEAVGAIEVVEVEVEVVDEEEADMVAEVQLQDDDLDDDVDVDVQEEHNCEQVALLVDAASHEGNSDRIWAIGKF
jgi:hypothetical protein